MKTLNRLDNVLARAECQAQNFDEGLMFDNRDCVVSGTMTNVFIVSQGRLLTPALNQSGVRGTIRDLTIEAARSAGIEWAEAALTRNELLGADEMFLTNALIGLWPVARFEGRTYRLEPMTRTLKEILHDYGVEECAA
jgi:4-amino-4-deoxychorismate lyase